MQFQKFLLLITTLVFSFGCTSSHDKIKIAGERKYIKNQGDKEVYELISKLTSSDFFEHTQGARELIKRGPTAIEVLYNCKHLKREVDGVFIPVCIKVIKVIFQEAETQWVENQVASNVAEISNIAKQELLKRRKKLS